MGNQVVKQAALVEPKRKVDSSSEKTAKSNDAEDDDNTWRTVEKRYCSKWLFEIKPQMLDKMIDKILEIDELNISWLPGKVHPPPSPLPNTSNNSSNNSQSSSNFSSSLLTFFTYSSVDNIERSVYKYVVDIAFRAIYKGVAGLQGMELLGHHLELELLNGHVPSVPVDVSHNTTNDS